VVGSSIGRCSPRKYRDPEVSYALDHDDHCDDGLPVDLGFYVVLTAGGLEIAGEHTIERIAIVP
jgi:hypothetical protein